MTNQPIDDYVAVTEYYLCAHCKGHGHLEEYIDVDYARTWKCKECNGEGEIVFSYDGPALASLVEQEPK